MSVALPLPFRKPHAYVAFIKNHNPGMTSRNALIESKRLKTANDPLWRQFEAEYKYDMVKSKIIELYHMVTDQENHIHGGRKTRKISKTRKRRV
jgi:hypothetical protein